MDIKAEQIAEILNGVVEGDPEVGVSVLAKIEEGEPGAISFLSNPKYEPYIYETRSSIVIVNKSFIPQKKINTTLIRVDDAYQAFTKVLAYYSQMQNQREGIEPQSFISDSAEYGEGLYLGSFSYIGANCKLGKNVKIYPQCYIGDAVEIGDDAVLYPGVKVYSNCSIGARCIIHSNTVIGSDGFGFAPNPDGSYSKIPQIGHVEIGNDVEIGAGSTIDCATMGATKIADGVKLDNQMQVAHNVEIGKHTVIAAQTGIAGSTKIGEKCVIGGQVGIVGHIKIGNKVKIQAQSGVSKSVKDEEILQGTPAFNYNDFTKSYVYFKQLPKLMAKKK